MWSEVSCLRKHHDNAETNLKSRATDTLVKYSLLGAWRSMSHKTTSYGLLSESLPSFLSWQNRTMLLIDTRGNPLLIEAFTLKIVETST